MTKKCSKNDLKVIDQAIQQVVDFEFGREGVFGPCIPGEILDLLECLSLPQLKVFAERYSQVIRRRLIEHFKDQDFYFRSNP